MRTPKKQYPGPTIQSRPCRLWPSDVDDNVDVDVDVDVDDANPRYSGRLQATRRDRSDYFVSGSPQDTEKIQ